jgi:Calponin homology (CH) domain
MNNHTVRATLRPLQEVNELETVPRKAQNRKMNQLIECSSECENVPGPFGDTLDSSALTSGLIKWCNAIARTHGLCVRNLTTCLADGRTLCFLIHHYHPTILPLSAVKSTTATILADHLKRKKVTVQDTKAAELEQFTEASASALSVSVLSKADIKRAQEGERMNFVTIKKACNAIGGTYLPHIARVVLHKMMSYYRLQHVIT